MEGIGEIKGARILLVEDNPINQQVAAELLAGQGLHVEVAGNGLEAVEMIRDHESGQAYDAVLMDINMPELDGYQATAAIRDDPRFTKLPIIAITANAMAEDRARCLAAGMNDHVSKPFEPEELFSALVRWVEPGDREIAESIVELKIGEAVADLPKVLPGLDLDSGLARVGGNRGLFMKLLMEFHEDYAGAANGLRQALDRGKVEDARQTAHTVKAWPETLAPRSCT